MSTLSSSTDTPSTNTQRPRRSRLLVALVLWTFLVACGGDDDADRVSLDFDESPINELLGIDIGLRSGDLVEMERRAEAGVVECMLAEGFTYIAVDFASQFDEGLGGGDPDSRAYAETNGYGVSIRPEFEAVDPADFVDPNDQIRASLSAAERDAYEQALYGDAPADGEQLSLEDRTGCVAESYRTVYAAQAEMVGVQQFFGDFASELAELEQRFRSDPRFVELESQWSACMADAGFNFAAREDIFVELDDRMTGVSVRMIPNVEPGEALQAEIDEIADWERAVAVADWDCTQPIQEQMRVLRFGYEALFLEENQGRLPNGS